jgi:Tol biopolymer transport system component
MRVAAARLGRLAPWTHVRAALVVFGVAAPCACGALWGFEEGTLGTSAGPGGSALGGSGGNGGSGGGGGAAGSSPNGGSGGAAIAALCPNVWGEFGNPAPLVGLNSDGSDIDPALSRDGHALYFASDSGGAGGMDSNYDLFVATREDAGSSFTAFAAVGELNSGVSDWSPDIAQDGLALYFSSKRAGGAGDFDLWVATRAEPNGPFVDAGLVAAVNMAGEDIDPAISPDGRTLYFATDQGGGGGRAIWLAERASTADPFGAPGPLAEVASTDSQFDPALSADGRELFFTRNTPDAARNLWVARRFGFTGPFTTVVAVGNINTAADDFAPALSADGTTLYFASNRDSGSWDLWVATRSCPE